MRRSKHNLSHYRLTSMNQGQLFPVACMEVLPGDSFRAATSALIRVSPLVAPVMHPVHVFIQHWFVPNRILWTNWENFITNAADDTLTIPTINVDDGSASSLALAQALGIGASGDPVIAVNALPFRAYNKIWNEFYRDQDLSTPLTEATGNTDTNANYAIRNVSWQKDYFTTARPYAQQGQDTTVALLDLNLGSAPVLGLGFSAGNPTTSSQTIRQSDGSVAASQPQTSPSEGTNFRMKVKGSSPNLFPDVTTDLSGLTGSASMDINEWRRAMATQRIREHRNRFGSRYTDYLRFLGVTPSDARLQRPEYLGGGRQTIAFSEVLATAEGVNTNVGDMSGHGIAAVRSRPFRRFFEEHGYILSFMFVRPKTVYMNQVPRTFLRRTWDDFWQKELEMMGEQEVTNAEVYGDSAIPNNIFGYVQRNEDYRRHPSFVSGEFRNLLDYWHMARKFTTQPVLNESFITADPTTDIYASAVNDQLYCMISHQISARRLVSRNARNG